MENASGMIREMQLPRNVVVGGDALDEVGRVASELGISGSAGVITGPTTRGVAGDRVADALTDAGFSVSVEVVDRVTTDVVDRVTEALDADVLFGVGGGRSIDTAKLVGKRLNAPFLSVPTAASHDGVASGRASLRDGGSSKSVSADAPLAVVADTAIIADAPERLMRSGCADVLSNKTAVLDWGLAERLRGERRSSYACTLAEMTARMVLKNASSIRPGLEESARVVTKSLISSGVAMSIAGSSRPASGAEHMFSHALDELAPGEALHGEQCGVGTIMTMYLHSGDWRSIRDALETIGAPTTAEGLGVDRDVVVDALSGAHEVRPERFTVLGSDGITREAAERAAEETGVIP